jgi:hypothetical protein
VVVVFYTGKRGEKAVGNARERDEREVSPKMFRPIVATTTTICDKIFFQT